MTTVCLVLALLGTVIGVVEIVRTKGALLAIAVTAIGLALTLPFLQNAF